MILPQDQLTILGGGLKFDIFAGPEERADYDRLLEAGFQDAYATAIAALPEQLCEDPQVADEHCTIGVSHLSNRLQLSQELAIRLGPEPSEPAALARGAAHRGPERAADRLPLRAERALHDLGQSGFQPCDRSDAAVGVGSCRHSRELCPAAASAAC